ncbi:MAG: zf-HC2 domain-containing protein [Spirochaetes bacterium]|nr:zf-HC2 domain-containing protein [Spirochaetota bacterium]
MSDRHIQFQTLSDLYDDVLPADEREAVRRHLQSCEACALEYRRLGDTLKLCREYAGLSLPLDGLNDRTMSKIRSARTRRLVLRSLPAMAASVLVIVGVGLFSTGTVFVRDRATVAGSRLSYSDSERVIDIIRKHNATISQVTGEYVEGTVPVSSFNDLKKSMGFRRVAYMMVDESMPDENVHWGDAIEEVGHDTGQPVRDWAPLTGTGASRQYVRFRVFR